MFLRTSSLLKASTSMPMLRSVSSIGFRPTTLTLTQAKPLFPLQSSLTRGFAYHRPTLSEDQQKVIDETKHKFARVLDPDFG